MRIYVCKLAMVNHIRLVKKWQLTVGLWPLGLKFHGQSSHHEIMK